MAGPSINNKIHQSGNFRLIEEPVASDSGTILPGMLLQESSVGGLKPHATAGAFASRMFAQEDALQGGTVNGIYYNGAYVGYTYAGLGGVGPDRVMVNAELPGNLTLALLLAGFNYTAGTLLISDGAGRLKPTTGSPTDVVAEITSIGAINLSASGAVNTLSQVRVR